MLTRATRLKLIAFVLLSVTVLGYTAVKYANLGRFLGMPGYYVIHMELADGGGIFPAADVTYRGVSVGRVGAVTLTASGVQANLDISDSAPPIPAHLRAAVADLSAVGEQYVDLRPQVSHGPYLTSGDVIPVADTQLPPSVTGLLTNVNTLATSLPLGALRSLMDSLGTGFGGQGSDLASLIDSNATLAHAADTAVPATQGLIAASKTVLGTQVAEASALNSFGQSAVKLAHALDGSNTSLGQLITAAPQAAAQVAGLIEDNNPALGALIANLLTTSEVTFTRGSALEELLSAFPAAVAAGSTAITAKGANIGLALTFFNPLACMAGYGGTAYRNGLDTGHAPPLNTGARCTAPPNQGDVRGAAHAPSGGAVPPAAQPGLARLMGLSP